MNLRQLLEVLAVGALLMIPLGMFLGALLRTARRRIGRWLPPRHLKLQGVRKRVPGMREGNDGAR